ncbi:RICIN domain-containing protein [Kitasatospora misakiensis]|uniref:RICIN domain-containing protein n=1 Tax=Kitasatospora misakiensis TaxID=67330 RepID=A0ABW0X597_9ACTN
MTDLRTYHYYALHEADAERRGYWAVSAVSPESGEVLGTMAGELAVGSSMGRGILCANSRGTHLYAGLDDGLHLVDTQTLTEVWADDSEPGPILNDSVWDAVVDHRRERLYVAVGSGGVVEIDTTTNTVLRRLESADVYAGVAVSSDGTRLYAGSSEGAPRVKVLNLADGTVAATVELAGLEVGVLPDVSVALSEDGSLLYTSSRDRKDSLAVVDTATLTVTARGSGYTELVCPDRAGQRVYAVVRRGVGFEGVVLAARTLERLGDFPLAPEGKESAAEMRAMTVGPDGALCVATPGGFVVATPAGEGRWGYQQVETEGIGGAAVVAGAATRYRSPAPERPARTVGVIKRITPAYFHHVQTGEMVANTYSSKFQPGERLPETTEVVQGHYTRGRQFTFVWYPIGLSTYKYFYYVPFWGIYIDGDDITWDDAASAAIPSQAGLVARHSGKLVEVTGSGTDGLADGARAQQWERRDADHQRFTLEPVEEGFYRITARHSGKVLEVGDASTDNGAAVRQWEWDGGVHQQWRPEPVGDGWYRLVARHSGRVLQIAVGTDGARNGAPVRQQEWANADHQKFRLDPLV